MLNSSFWLLIYFIYSSVFMLILPPDSSLSLSGDFSDAYAQGPSQILIQ